MTVTQIRVTFEPLTTTTQGEFIAGNSMVVYTLLSEGKEYPLMPDTVRAGDLAPELEEVLDLYEYDRVADDLILAVEVEVKRIADDLGLIVTGSATADGAAYWLLEKKA
jgi:hypothetical protein